MKKQFLTFSALLLGLVLVNSACSMPEKIENVEKSGSGVVSEADLPDEAATPNDPMAMPGQEVVSKENLEKLIFNENFTSNNYYNEVFRSAKEIQNRIVYQEAQEDVSACKKLNTANEITSCESNHYLSKAYDAKDKGMCAKLSDKNMIKSCENRIAYMLIIESDNEEKCGEIEDQIEQNMCRDEIHMRKEMKAMEEEMMAPPAVEEDAPVE